MAESLGLFLIDDEGGHALLMRKSLERAGHQVTMCRTGTDALIVLGHSHPFHLMILDQKLPDMAGLDLMRALQREGITIPVVMVTAKGDQDLAIQVLRAGALDYIIRDDTLIYLAELPKRVTESVTRHRLQQKNQLLIEAIESARDGIMITDREGKLEQVNGALERMFGYARAELLGQTPRLLKSGLHLPAFFEDMWRTILAGSSWQGELVNKRKDGTLLSTSLTISPIMGSRGRLTHFVGIYRDISERKAMERQLFQAQKMQSVGTLAGGVAHEFNNLLAGIQGYATLGLREKGASEPVREFFQFIVDLSERAANLTRQLLAFARKPALTRQPTSMEKLLLSTADLVRTSLKIELEVTIPNSDPADPLLALADANQLQQVLVNLALNARDAMTQPASRPVAFRLRRQVVSGRLPAFPEDIPAGDYVILEVEDHGAGMTAEVLAQALDPFFTTKEVGQGTGLGLPVACGIVQGHQGFLTIDTEVGKGTCVRLYLPRLLDKHVETMGTPPAPQVPEPDQPAGRRILVIDDEEAVLDVIRRFLQIGGHHVSAARSASEGLEVLEKEPIDLVVLDLMIPREDGTANFRRFRQRFPGIPVLLCTGLAEANQAAQLLRDGAADLLRKPFRMNELWSAVNKALT
jgi:two-component system cell cycle sensor histidine kinase/response regulator CckA